MYAVEYYTKRNGRQPAAEWRKALDTKSKVVAEWRKALDTKSKVVIDGKIQKLRQYGLKLLGTEMLTPIVDNDFYELRGGQCRIAVYYDRGRDAFVLLHGWRKKKQVQKQAIEQARRLLHEYLSGEGE